MDRFKKCQHGICGCCGASKKNGYQHKKDCLINLPGPLATLLPYWNAGWETFRTLGKYTKLTARSDKPEEVARMMGCCCCAQVLADIEEAEARGESHPLDARFATAA